MNGRPSVAALFCNAARRRCVPGYPRGLCSRQINSFFALRIGERMKSGREPGVIR